MLFFLYCRVSEYEKMGTKNLVFMKNLLVFFFILCTSLCFSQNRNYKTINVALKAHFDSICKYDTTNSCNYKWGLNTLLLHRRKFKEFKSVIRKFDSFLLIEKVPFQIGLTGNRYLQDLFYNDSSAIFIQSYDKNVPEDYPDDYPPKGKKQVKKNNFINRLSFGYIKSSYDFFQSSISCYSELLDTNFNYNRLRLCPECFGCEIYVFTIFKSGKARVLLGYLNSCDINPETCKYEPSEAIKELMNKKKE